MDITKLKFDRDFGVLAFYEAIAQNESARDVIDISRNYDFATNCQGFQLGFWTLLEMSNGTRSTVGTRDRPCAADSEKRQH
jgi:hypothetical protein